MKALKYVETGLKKCPQCKTHKSLNLFYERKGRPGQLGSLCKDCYKEKYHNEFKDLNEHERAIRRERSKRWWWDLKMQTVTAYGGKCECCGERRLEFLTVDHKRGGGTQHRKQLGGGNVFLIWLKNEGFPTEDYRLLCMNCNFSHGRYGYCPHEKQEP